jgi:membrane-bound lytic murein transglycosylase D
MYHLEINSYVDERRDPVKETEAAAQFLSNLYDIYHDWTLVIAAYNCGPGNVNKAIRRSGGKRNFWEIYYRLPRETRGYVPAFIAATYTFYYYKDYNIKPIKIDMPVAVDTLNIDEKLHLAQVANVLHIPIEQLRELNPQYKKDIIPARKNAVYALKIPSQYTMSFIDYKDSIMNYKDSVYFAKHQVIAPKKYERGKGINPPSKKGLKAVYYTIKSGDNLGFISSWYHVKASDIRYWNNIYRNNIRAGKKLVIYVPKNKVTYYKKINHLSFAEKQKRIGKSVVNKTKLTKPAKYDKNAKYVMYKVRRGDNFWSIARKYSGVSNTDIMELNGIDNPSSLKVGTLLRIKKK